MAFQLQQQELGGLLSPLQAGAAHKQVGRGVHTEAGIERERTVRMPRPAPAARGFLVVTARKPGVGAIFIKSFPTTRTRVIMLLCSELL